MSEEIWADISGYEGWYQASTEGRIKRIKKVHWNHGKKNIVYRDHILKTSADKKGYRIVILSNPDVGLRKQHKVHRVIAETFIDNPFGYKQVDHINRDKSDNRIENLRWCNGYMNMNNREENVLISANGLVMTLSEWSAMTGIKHYTIYARKKRGWSDEDAVKIPVLKEGERLCRKQKFQQM